MGSLRALLALSALLLALLSACGTTSDAPPQPNDDNLDCLSYPLTSFCCEDAGPRACPGDFAAAALCTTWPQGFTVRSYATACHGLLGVSVLNAQYTTVYVFDSNGALYAIGDDAASNQPGSLALECGAGPEGFTMPSDCAATWLDKTQGVACGTGTATPASICH